MPPPSPMSPTCECRGSKLSRRQNSGPHTEVVFCEYDCCKSQLAPKQIPFYGIAGVNGHYPGFTVAVVLHPKWSSSTPENAH